MASNERSLGWNTGTTNDGATTYDTARMIAMELKTLGNGMLRTGSQLIISVTGLTTLTIGDGAALINGYFYESTTTSTIPAVTLNGTYTLALIANNSGGTYTVSRSTADTTTVLTSTVRMALATSAQLTTIGAANYISFATVVVGATGIISTITRLYPFALTLLNSNPQHAFMFGGTASLTAANTFYDVTNYAGGGVPSADLTIRIDPATGEMKIYLPGVYIFSFWVYFDTNTTGVRNVNIRNLGFPFMPVSASVIVGTSFSVYSGSTTVSVNPSPGVPASFFVEVSASNSGRSVTDSRFTVTRV